MKLLETVLITFVALSVSGSSAGAGDDSAGDSFVATTTLNGENVVPSVLSTVEGDLCLKISERPTTSTQTIGETFAQQAPRRNPWQFKLGTPGNVLCIPVQNVRLYFGQDFSNGQPILTLCDDDIEDGEDDEFECHDVDDDNFDMDIPGFGFDLSSIQFQSEQIDTTSEILVDQTGRLSDLECPGMGDDEVCGFLVIKRLIDKGLIYVVVNSDFKIVEKRADGTFKYEPPKGRRIVDGDLRGTLILDKELDECPPPDPEAKPC